MGEYICNWCGEPLKFLRDKGFVHLDGNLYKRKIMIVDGKKTEYDEHYALPVERERLAKGK